jgi:predicted RNase H-like HicB family nuclease
MKSKYSMVIQWSDEDQAYVVSFPEFGGSHTHGSSYEDAARQGTEVLQLLAESYQAEGQVLPSPCMFESAETVAAT